QTLHECPLHPWRGRLAHAFLLNAWARRPRHDYFAAVIFTSTTPCGATVASYLSLKSPRSFCRHRSRTVCLPVRFSSESFATSFTGSTPTLNNPTAFDPSSRFFAYTRVFSSLAAVVACLPSAS